MHTRLDRAHRAAPVFLGAITLASVLVLLVWDARPSLFPANAHNLLGAVPLALIGIAYLLYQGVHRPSLQDWTRATILAVAFFFWAANQLWPTSPLDTLYNDIAIALFVLDVFLTMIGWPSSAPDESFGETSLRKD